MSLIPAPAAIQAATRGFYPASIDQSLRFNDDDSAYLSWTPSYTGDLKTWTWSAWLKRSTISTNQTVFGTGTGLNGGGVAIWFKPSNEFSVYNLKNDFNEVITTAVYRDTSAWYHFVVTVDTTETTTEDRLKIYVNGQQITDFSATSGYPNLNASTRVNDPTYINGLGGNASGTVYPFDGYMAEVNFLNGIAATADDFGELKNGVWVAKAYEGAYDSAAQISAGTTNGFYLDFSATGTQFPITANGSVQHSTAQSKTGASSILFDGNGDYLETPANSEFALGTGDFTIEGWFYHNNSSLPTYEHLWGNYSSSGAGYAGNYALQFNYGSNVAYFYYGNGLAYTLSLGSAFTAQTWHHVAIVRSSGTTTLYIDGVSKASTSDSASYASSYPFCIGNYRDAAEANSFNGYIDEFRISTVARYTSGFTPSTTAFESDSDTLYLVQSDTTNGSTTFTDSSGVPSGLGNEVSGNGNHWTTNNIDFTDQILDSPTDNFCTWNPVARQTGTVGTSNLPTFSDGNLTAASSANNSGAHGTFLLSSGQWYWEVTLNTNNVVEIGIAYDGSESARDEGVLYYNDGRKRIDGTLTSYGSSFTVGDVIGIALDADSDSVTFYKNNVSQGAISYTPQLTDPTPAIWMAGATSTKVTANFGQQDFTYTPPSGYLAISTANLPDPVIDPAQDDQPRDYFETFLYTGNGAGLQVGDVIKKPTDTITISSSLIFNNDDSAHLSRTSATGDDRKTWTVSTWAKRGSFGSQTVFGAGYSGSGYLDNLSYRGTNKIMFYLSNAGGTGGYGHFETDRVIVDNDWHHIVWTFDSTEAVATDRMRVYIDGLRQSGTWIITPSTQNFESTYINNVSTTYYLGRFNYSGTSDLLDGYLAEFHFCDGTAYNADAFGEFDANGIWIPKTPSVTYGSNGFHLDFSDNTNTTTLGEDQTVNGNDWTLNNFATTDQVSDSPTDNHMTMNPTYDFSGGTFSEGNLKVVTGTTEYGAATSAFALKKGKYFCEITQGSGSYTQFGCVSADASLSTTTGVESSAAKGFCYVQNDGSFRAEGSTTSGYGATWTSGNIIGMALNLDDNEVTYYKDGVSQGTVSIPEGRKYLIAISDNDGGTGTTCTFNFGQKTFYGTDGSGTLPTGFTAISENNITVDDQNLESPDLVWIKNRSAADKHHMYDSVRGVQKALYPSETNAETDEPDGLLDFNANGFTIGSEPEINTSGEDYVAWCWKLGGAPTATNTGSIGGVPTSGSIMIDGTSSTTALSGSILVEKLSANTKSGISVLRYTGTNVTGTIDHGLTQAPEFVMCKGLIIGTNQWAMASAYLPSWASSMELDNNGSATSISSRFTSTPPTDTVFNVGNSGYTNANVGNEFEAFCIHSVEGMTKVGLYIGNGNADGPFVYCGFRPAFTLIKRYDATENWWLHDTKRDPTNIANHILYGDLPNAEIEGTGDNQSHDYLSNGFKLRTANANWNASGGDYLFVAFAENPFKYSNAR